MNFSGIGRDRTQTNSFRLILAGLLVSISPAVELFAADGQKKNNLNAAESLMNPVLVEYYNDFMKTQEIETFRQKVLARYTEPTLVKLLESGQSNARRAAVLALSLTGSMQSNAALAGRFKDDDAVVRAYTERGLWILWNRADSAENNAELEKIHSLISEEKFDEAIKSSTVLIEKAPKFAEAWNQRAIAHYMLGNYAKSVADCREVLKRNPYHFGAMSGMSQCLMKQGRINEALQALQEQLKLQPHNEGIRAAIEALDRGRS